MQVEKSGWSFGVIKNAILVIGNSLLLPWLDSLDSLMKAEEFTPEVNMVEQTLDYLLKNGEFLLKELRTIGTSIPQEIIAKISEQEQDPSFAREMSFFRRKVARVLERAGYEFSEGPGSFSLWLDKLWELLEARNASPAQPLVEESLHACLSENEHEYAAALSSYVKDLGWNNIPMGEREEAVLCLCQHAFAVRDFESASEFLVDAIETGITDPLIYYNYFILGINVENFEPAMQGFYAACETSPKLSPAPSDRYQIQGILGRNSVSTSFVAKDEYEQRQVIIKILNDPPSSVRKAIVNAVKLKHAGVAEIYSFHEIHKTRPCLAVEYVEGPTLGEIVKKEGPIPAADWLQIALQITGALAYAHDQGIVHGNLTPSSLYYNGGQLKVLDFCFSPLDQWKFLGRQDLENIYFMSPEHLNTNRPAQMTDDVYSLGKTLYFLLTGQIPHLMYQESVPSVIWPILRKATDLDLSVRHQNATELLADLAQASESPLSLPVQTKLEDNSGKMARDRIIPLQDGGTVLLPKNFFYRDGLIHCQLDDSQMVLIPEGPFIMGSEERITESPVREVHLSHYLMDKFPVTNAQYARFLDYIQKSGDLSMCHPDQPKDKDHTPKGWNTPEYKKYSPNDNCPVVFIDWWDAWAYSIWADKQLPTEAQWEKAARGTEGLKFPWGEEEPSGDFTNYNKNLGRTSIVGSFPKGISPYGCMDLAGNVWEWCRDTYEKNFYREASRENPFCESDKLARSLRGGSWSDGDASVRATCRGCWVHTVRYGYIGFRCVREL